MTKLSLVEVNQAILAEIPRLPHCLFEIPDADRSRPEAHSCACFHVRFPTPIPDSGAHKSAQGVLAKPPSTTRTGMPSSEPNDELKPWAVLTLTVYQTLVMYAKCASRDDIRSHERCRSTTWELHIRIERADDSLVELAQKSR